MKLVITDLDGTFLNEEKEVSKENIEAFKRAEKIGTKLVIASGRPHIDIYNIAKDIGINPYIISSNGAYIYDINGDVIKNTCIDLNSVKEILKFCETYNIFIQIATEKNIFISNKWGSLLENDFIKAKEKNKKLPQDLVEKTKIIFNKIHGITEVESLTDLLVDGFTVSYMSIFSYDLDILNKIKTSLGKYSELLCPFSGIFNFEIIKKGSTKGDALEYLCDYLKINIEDTVAFGDNFNDITMIKKAGIGVAMANAESEVKEKADIITESNDNNGVAKIINNILDTYSEVASSKI